MSNHTAEYYRQYYLTNSDKTRERARKSMRKWRQENPELARQRRRMDKLLWRARKVRARTEKRIHLTQLHNWENKLCGICTEFIDGDYHIDHIIPLSKGGEHSVANLQLAHPFCNRSKSNRLPGELEMV
jgi:5-methylcytosine-specific restriction endonuclease McrA